MLAEIGPLVLLRSTHLNFDRRSVVQAHDDMHCAVPVLIVFATVVELVRRESLANLLDSLVLRRAIGNDDAASDDVLHLRQPRVRLPDQLCDRRVQRLEA